LVCGPHVRRRIGARCDGPDGPFQRCNGDDCDGDAREESENAFGSFGTFETFGSFESFGLFERFPLDGNEIETLCRCGSVSSSGRFDGEGVEWTVIVARVDDLELRAFVACARLKLVQWVAVRDTHSYQPKKYSTATYGVVADVRPVDVIERSRLPETSHVSATFHLMLPTTSVR